MSTSGPEEVTMEEFKLMTERAGLWLSAQELEELKPLYELYMQQINIKALHSIDLGAEEMAVDFHPDWRAS